MLLRSRGRTVTVKEPLPPSVYEDLATPAFEAVGRQIKATVQPRRGSTVATRYGEDSTRMLLMLTTDARPLREGMGVCLYGQDGACDYRIAAPVEAWTTHQRAVLKKL